MASTTHDTGRLPMADSAGVALQKRILARHGARPDLRLWRNESGLFWAGKPHYAAGSVTLQPFTRVKAGLCKGSADLIGLTDTGRFIALEIKTAGDRLDDRQRRFLDLIIEMGGIGAVVESVDDVDRVLGAPPT